MAGNDHTTDKQVVELKKRIATLEHALAATDVHFTVHDRQGRFLYVNPRGLAAQNLRLEDVEGKSWRELGFPEEVGIPFEKQVEQVFTEEVNIRTETEFPTKDGPRIFENVFQPAYDNAGNVVALVATRQDITDIRTAEEALRKSNSELQERTKELAAALDTARQLRDQAEQANRAKDTFLANMSHELRTPLNSILGYSQLMSHDEDISPTQQEYLETIARSGEHLLGLINNVLTMSKIEAGHTTLQENAFGLHLQIHGLQEMFQLRTDHKGLTLLVDIAPDVPDYIYADEGKLRQVLMNLLSNAVKFTKEGGVALRIGCQNQDIKNASTILIIEIEDTGVGIAPEEMEMLFKPFIQTASGQQSQEGTGLGLSISKQFVNLMGGELNVRSVVGEGTTFRVQIPVTLADADTVEGLEISPQRRVTGIEPGQTAPDGGPFRLLIVEDNLPNRELLIKLLAPFGFELRSAVNGAEGVEMWEAWQPHLVWMDMRLPVMDGYEATRQIKDRAEATGRSAIVIALTASAFEEDRDAILEAGCDDFIRKPFREHQIFDALHRHLGLRFVLEDIPLETPVVNQISPEDLREAAKKLPTSWAADLHQSAIALDIEGMLAHIESVRSRAPQLADTLTQWVHDFEYEKLMELVAPESES